MYINEIIESTNGLLLKGNNILVNGFSIDTRTINENDIYISLKGDNHDGNEFINVAIDKKCSGVIYSGEIDENIIKNNDIVFIKVDDTTISLQEMARFKRSKYNIPVVAITGSVGKTSTKDIISSVMSKKYNVLSTKGNLNNHIGLPLTLLGLNDHDAMCIEMGMNHFKELSLLTNILKPTVAVITNIGTAHIGNLGSRENILKAKLEILEGLTSKVVVINNDNDLLNNWNKENNYYDVITYGINNLSNFNASNIKLDLDSSTFDIEINNKKYNIEIDIPGSHFIYNALCAISIGNLLEINIEDIIAGIKEFKLSSKRMEIKKIDNKTLLIDCYNANYDSMKSALEVLGKYNERKIAVLGDMLELGDFSEILHSKIGKLIDTNNIDILITIGNFSNYIHENANIETKYHCTTNEEAVLMLKNIVQKDDIILFKASNSMNFIEIVNNLT